MAGCFGNHPFDRAMERELFRHLEEEERNTCPECEGEIENDVCIDCGYERTERDFDYEEY